MQTTHLNGIWMLCQANFDCIGTDGLKKVLRAEHGWIEAEVPGEVHLDLIRAKQMPEPAISVNMPECRWPETKSWWYKTQFNIDDDFIQHDQQQLVFDGVDLYAQVFLNSKLIGESWNAFVPVSIDIKQFLKLGQNELVVRITAGSELVNSTIFQEEEDKAPIPHLVAGDIPNPIQNGELYKHRMWSGRKWLRKPQYSYGWDWVDAMPNIGIWREVHLEARTHAIIHDLRLDTVRCGTEVSLEMEVSIENVDPFAERSGKLKLKIQPPDESAAIYKQYDLNMLPGRFYVKDLIRIPHAKLWWPNGMGEQPLYKITAHLSDTNGTITDTRQLLIGLRTIEIDQSNLPEGKRFCICINGEDVFCRGANLGPHDAILARVSDEKYQTLVREAKNANINMFRVNGCSCFEPPAFYEACDRDGILVWQDFMLTCCTYPDHDLTFCNAVRLESMAAIRRLRHHPSIVLWCGNNESIWLFEHDKKDKNNPLEIGGVKLYNQILPELCALLDPRRPYRPSSPIGGESPNSELQGDCHWWFSAFMSKDMNRRIRHEIYDECRARFVSEYGAIGPCHIDSVREYLTPEEMQPTSLAWKMHTNSYTKETVPAAINYHYADTENLSIEQYLIYGQMFQAIIYGNAMEALRFRKHDPENDCQGALIWSYSDCWGETGWSILDYYLRRKASYYWMRSACKPIKIIVRQIDGFMRCRLLNDTLQDFSGTVELGWWKLDGTQKDVVIHSVNSKANSMQELDSAIVVNQDHNPQQWLYGAILRQNSDEATIDQSLVLMKPFRKLTLTQSDIMVTQVSHDILEITSQGFCHGVHLEDHGREVISDNWFDLLPGIPIRVKIAKKYQGKQIHLKALFPGNNYS